MLGLMAPAAPVLNIEGDWLRMPVSAWDHAGFRSWVSSPDFPERARATFVARGVYLRPGPLSNRLAFGEFRALGGMISSSSMERPTAFDRYRDERRIAPEVPERCSRGLGPRGRGVLNPGVVTRQRYRMEGFELLPLP